VTCFVLVACLGLYAKVVGTTPSEGFSSSALQADRHIFETI